jgi:nitrate/nitrite transporter NarK
MVILVIGVNIRSFPIMVLSRLLYGTAGDSMVALSIAMFAEYFRSEELGLVIGIYFLLSHLGVLLTLSISPLLAEHYGVALAYDLSVGFSLLGLIFRIFLAKTDQYFLKLKRAYEETHNIKKEIDRPLDFSRGCKGFWKAFSEKFKKEFWLTCFFGISMFNGIYLLINLGKTYLVEKFYADLTQVEKDQTTDLELFVFQIVIIIGNLFFGVLSYRFKTYLWAYLPGPFLFFSAISLLMLSISPIIAFVLAGISVSVFYSNFWSNLMITLAEKDRVFLLFINFHHFFGDKISGICFWNHGFS